MADKRGFTLIELLIAVVILGILVAMAMPEVNGIIQMQKVKTEARKMASHLRAAQQEAISTETSRAAIFSSTSEYIANGKTVILPPEVRYTVSPGGTGQVTFSPLGIPAPASITIQFVNGEGQQVNVLINPSGRINITAPTP